MTMFTRNEKPGEAVTAPATRIAATAPEAPSPPAARAEVIRQPISSQPHSPEPSSHSVSVISRALKITGQLESTENIRIDGEIEGDVRGVSVAVGSNAKVKGSVYGEEVELAGTVEGKIEAKKVVLTSTARMSGDVIHQEISIQNGAFIRGHCLPDYGKPETKSGSKIDIEKAPAGRA